MTIRQVCSDIAGIAFANEVAWGTWEGDALSPPSPDPDFDCVAGIPVTTVIRFDRRDDPEARTDEIVVTFPSRSVWGHARMVDPQIRSAGGQGGRRGGGLR
jgi:hypothetical protein